MGDRFTYPLRDWSFLPDDVIQLIVNRIKSIEDLIAMASVCRSWRSITVKDYSIRRAQLPWLMLSANDDSGTKGFLNLDRYTYYDITFPNLQGSRYWGSKFGWVLILCLDRQFHLFNPFTQARLDLPPKPIFKDEIDHKDDDNGANSIAGFVRKALVFRDEDQDQLVVVAIGSVSGNLALSRPGSKCWVQVKTPFGRVLSAVWFKQQLFFMLGSGTLMCCENGKGGRFEVKEFVSKLEDINIWDNIGLVELCNDLFMVVRFYFDDKEWHKTSYFVVYKLDFEERQWIKTKDLGDCALFIDGDDNAVALKGSEVCNCKNNCIYFVEKYWDGYGRYRGSHDVGVYDMKEGLVEPYYIKDPNSSALQQTSPIWVMPSLS